VTEHTNNIKITQPKKRVPRQQHNTYIIVNNNNNQKKPRLRDRTDRAWFSHLLWHPARRNGAGLFVQPRSPHGAMFTRSTLIMLHYFLCLLSIAWLFLLGCQ